MTTFSISLDDVDLALLPVRSRQYNDFLKKEHYEFRVMAQDTVASDPQLYTCHTCAVDVPSAYTREHWASAKHRANARIASVAAQRMRALVNSPPPPAQSHLDGKFCESCSSTVGKDHEKTKEHRIAVIHDRMLIDLMKIYVGDDDELDNETRTDNYTTVANINDATGNVTGEVINAAKTVNDVATPNGATSGTVAEIKAIESDQAQVTQGREIVQNIENVSNATDTKEYVKIDTETYIKLLNTFPESPKIALKAAGDEIKIIFTSETVTVPNDNFHSYYRMKGKIQCRVCCETLNIVTEHAHKLSKIHMERVSKAVTDSHCVREIYEDWSHCIICNQVMKGSTIVAHKQTKMHYDLKRNVTEITAGNTPVTKETPKNQQNPSTSGINNKYPITQQNYSQNTNDKIEHPYRKTKNPMNVFCTVCDCDVPIKLSNREDHLKGMRHAYSLKNAKNNVKNYP